MRMTDLLIQYLFQGDVDKTILIDDTIGISEDLSEPIRDSTELIKDSDFENADFTKTFDATPVVFGEWVTYTDAKNEKIISVILLLMMKQ